MPVRLAAALIGDDARLLFADVLGLARSKPDLIADVVERLTAAERVEWLVAAVSMIAGLMDTVARAADQPVADVYDQFQALARRDR